MTKKIFLPIILFTTFIHCSKDKDDSPPPDLNKGLLVNFLLNGNFNDSLDNADDVTYGGFLSHTKNRHGYNNRAISFNGGSFSFGTTSLPANPISISLWLKPKNLDTDGYLILSSEGAFGVYQSLSKLGLAISTPSTESALADIAAEWTHFCGTYDGKDIKTYINGKLAKTFHHPGVPDVTGLVNVGGNGVPEWQGVLDDIRFYSRVLSEAEIKLLSAQ